jgi:SAM-dependent methyltransferase
MSSAPEAGFDAEAYWSERLREHYDLRGVGHLSYSIGYNRWMYRRKRDLLRLALRGIAAPFAALDIGSGTGWVVRELLELGGTVEGCDLSELAVERLTASIPAARFFQLVVGADPIPRPDESFDVVTAIDVTYHITDDAHWRDALAEVARVLRPGGRFVITDRLDPVETYIVPQCKCHSRAEWEEQAGRHGLRLDRVDDLFSWLTRTRDEGLFRYLPDTVRGMIEYALERIAPRAPIARSAVFLKAQTPLPAAG